MLSGLVTKFLQRLTKGQESLENIINSYVYSERYMLAVDFEVIRKKLTEDIPCGTVLDQRNKQKISLRFFSGIIAGVKLIVLVREFNNVDRLMLASVVCDVKEKLLEEIRFLVEQDKSCMENEQNITH